MTNRELAQLALSARELSYCPYSGYAVGAALYTASGKVYTIKYDFWIITIDFSDATITLPTISSGTSIVRCSIGSHLTPFRFLSITLGCPTCNSNPSLLIVSISTER